MAFWKLLLVPLALFVFLPSSASGKVPFARSTFTYETPRRRGGVPAPTPAPVLRKQHFRRGEETCGVLEGGYTDALPVCSGSASYCTFTSSSGYQGCCQNESLDSCTFYTACYAYSDRASCTGSCTSSGLVWYVGTVTVMYYKLVDLLFCPARAQHQNALDIHINGSPIPQQVHGRDSLAVHSRLPSMRSP